MRRDWNEQKIVVPNPEMLAKRAADYFSQAAQKNVATHGRLTVALSGGSTPKAMFTLLAASPYREEIPWSQIFFFWGDERCVPPDHPDSNYRMTQEILLSKVPVASTQIFRMEGEKEPAQAARNYAAQIKAVLGENPQFDLIFLGLGADGHTASLFPGTAALQAPANLIVVENYVEKLQAFRLTLTASTINQAKQIIFLVGGADKAVTLKNVMLGPYQPEVYPSQLIQPQHGELIWLLDEAASSELA